MDSRIILAIIVVIMLIASYVFFNDEQNKGHMQLREVCNGLVCKMVWMAV